MLKNKDSGAKHLENIIIIDKPDPYAFINHLKDPIKRTIEGASEDSEPVVFYSKSDNSTFILNYLHVPRTDKDDSELRVLSMLIDPYSTVLFPQSKNLNRLRLMLQSKKLLNKKIDLTPLKLLDDLSQEFNNANNIIFTLSESLYSLSRIWDSEELPSAERVFDQIMDFLKTTIAYHHKGLSKAITTFLAFAMDMLVYHRLLMPAIVNKIVIVSSDIKHEEIKSVDIIMPGKPILNPIVVLNYKVNYSEAFYLIPEHAGYGLENLHISDISIFLSRLFHKKSVHLVTNVLRDSMEAIMDNKQKLSSISEQNTQDVSLALHDLLKTKYGIKENDSK